MKTQAAQLTLCGKMMAHHSKEADNLMGWFILTHLFSTLIQLIRIGRQSDQEKDLEIIILRYQLDMAQRKLQTPLKPTRAEKLTLGVLVTKLKQGTRRPVYQLRDLVRLFQPETVLRWHRQLIRRKWTYATHTNKGGRPALDQEIEALIVRLAQENNSWGYGKIAGELLKLGFDASQTSIRNILDRYGIVPAPIRNGSLGWRHLMTHYKQQILACDFFTVETLWLQTLYMLFYIKVGSRRVYLAGVTAHPDGFWVAQQARQYVWALQENEVSPHFLIRDNDKKFTDAHDTVFRSERIRLIPTPFQAPNANAFTERWVRPVREECLDRLLIFNENHLRRVLTTFIEYHNTARPHQGLEQQTPIPCQRPTSTGPVRRTLVLGFISDYYRGSD